MYIFFYQFHAFLIFFNIRLWCHAFLIFPFIKQKISPTSQFYHTKLNKHAKFHENLVQTHENILWSEEGEFLYEKPGGVAARVWYFLECSASEGPQSEQPEYLLGYQVKKRKNWYLLHLEKEIFKPCTKKQYPGTFSFFSTCPLSSKKCMK